MWDWRGLRHRAYLCVLLLQSDDGKKRTGAYPFAESLSLTDAGAENRPGVSSLCNPRRESGNKPRLAGERALTAARSPSLAASCSLPPSTSPAAASTGNAESSQVDAGDDPPTATAEPRSLSCNRRWQHLLPRRAQSSSARHARIAPAKPCVQCRRCRRKLFSALELELDGLDTWNWMGHLTIGDPKPSCHGGLHPVLAWGAAGLFPAPPAHCKRRQKGLGLGEPGRNHDGAPATSIRPRAGRPLPGAGSWMAQYAAWEPGPPEPKLQLNASQSSLPPCARRDLLPEAAAAPSTARCACREWYSRCR
jgi:hypothetical protein